MLVNCLSVADGKGPGNAGSLIFWITVKCSLAFCIQRPLAFEWNTFPWVHLVIPYRTLSKWLILTVPILITPSNIKLDSLKPYSRRWGVRNERNNFNEQQWLICFLGLHNVVSNCWCKLFFVPFQIFSMYPLWVARGFWIGKREDRCRCFAIWPNEPEMTRRCAGSVDFFLPYGMKTFQQSIYVCIHTIWFESKLPGLRFIRGDMKPMAPINASRITDTQLSCTAVGLPCVQRVRRHVAFQEEHHELTVLYRWSTRLTCSRKGESRNNSLCEAAAPWWWWLLQGASIDTYWHIDTKGIQRARHCKAMDGPMDSTNPSISGVPGAKITGCRAHLDCSSLRHSLWQSLLTYCNIL